MRFQTIVEPPEPMRGLEIPAAGVASLGGGKRPRVVVTLGGHTWRTRVAVMRGRSLIGLSIANRTATGVEVGQEVTVEVVLDEEPITAAEPTDLTSALEAEPAARAAFDRLTVSQQRQHIRVVEQAKGARTRTRRINALVSGLIERS
ncbi:YdeI/OmpD-associated family protein [Gryllotalpicola koreensis]|uniref:DUF1905 domain-containing protein n=1 Tax=Gryllotalpicola koreensis TaxID=993086 RepID=A0ABP7ZQF7_9MICO